ncbi:iron chelate uptake ABC transporter family permease subunit [Lactiplantibacillus plantarum]|nr:iron chelate uptake ABC transporter family permease subunit [Lactiplantibacillus plantarum]
MRTATVWHALTTTHTGNLDQQIIRHIRVPRVLGAALIGAALAGSGALMQAVTRNPLADSGLLGINAGAGLMLTLCLAFFQSYQLYKRLVGPLLARQPVPD